MADLRVTIDDGPTPGDVLAVLLDELGRRGLVAAFFVIGKRVERTPSAAVAIRDRGHVLGNHSWDHLPPSTAGYSDAAIIEQFRRAHEEVRRACAVPMRHWRAPRLEQVPRLSRLLNGGEAPLYDRPHCDAEADSRDWQDCGAAAMLEHLRSSIARQPGREAFRLLFHVRPATAAAFAAVLDGLEADGHRLVDFREDG